MIPHKQLTLAEIFDDCQNKFDNDKYQFLQLLDETLNLETERNPVDYPPQYGGFHQITLCFNFLIC